MSNDNRPKTATKRTFWTDSAFEIDDEKSLKESRDEKYVQSMIRKANQQIEDGKYEAAEAYLRNGLARVPHHPECMAYMAICIAESRRQYLTAEKVAKHVIEKHPENAEGYYALGRVNLSGSRRRIAFRNFQKAGRLTTQGDPLSEELEKMEPRQLPIVTVLPRDHSVNVRLGKLRAFLLSRHRIPLYVTLILLIFVILIVMTAD